MEFACVHQSMIFFCQKHSYNHPYNTIKVILAWQSTHLATVHLVNYRYKFKCGLDPMALPNQDAISKVFFKMNRTLLSNFYVVTSYSKRPPILRYQPEWSRCLATSLFMCSDYIFKIQYTLDMNRSQTEGLLIFFLLLLKTYLTKCIDTYTVWY